MKKWGFSLEGNILPKVKSYIDNYLFPTKWNIVDPSQDNIEQPPTIPQIPSELKIAKEYYYKAVSISKDDDYEIYLIRPPNSYFLNNYCDGAQSALQANMNPACFQPIWSNTVCSLYTAYFA